MHRIPYSILRSAYSTCRVATLLLHETACLFGLKTRGGSETGVNTGSVNKGVRGGRLLLHEAAHLLGLGTKGVGGNWCEQGECEHSITGAAYAASGAGLRACFARTLLSRLPYGVV